MRLIRGAFLLFLWLAVDAITTPCFAANSVEYFNTGLALYKQGNYTQAIQYFNAAVSLDPTLWQAYQGLAQSEKALGKNAEALDACEKSLELHPDNPFLVRMDNELKPLVNGPLQIPLAIPTIGGKVQAAGPEMAPSLWFKGSFLYGYSADSDLNSAVDGWKHALPEFGGHQFKSSAGTMGIGFQLEMGHPIDPENAFSLGLLNIYRPGFAGNATGVNPDTGLPFTLTESIQPTIYAMEFGYSHFWPGRNNRYFVKCGIGYYYASVDLNVLPSASAPATFFTRPSGILGNGDFGVFLGGGYELKISNSWGLEISGLARYASITDIVATRNENYNKILYGLALDPLGFVWAIPASQIGQNGYRFATIDLTGFEIHLGLVYYLFD